MPGEVLGLIGPNGSGKSTLVNVISGVTSLDQGRLFLDGAEISSASAVRRARAGITRTFQNLRIFGGLTVAENVQLGFRASGGRRAAHGRDIPGLLAQFGLTLRARDKAATLSYGEQRRVELARAVAGAPRLLLIDEPAAGLNEHETQVLASLVRSISRDTDCATLLIDHDVSFILSLCPRLYVLDEGTVIFSGASAAAASDETVREAYLGVEDDDASS